MLHGARRKGEGWGSGAPQTRSEGHFSAPELLVYRDSGPPPFDWNWEATAATVPGAVEVKPAVAWVILEPS